MNGTYYKNPTFLNEDQSSNYTDNIKVIPEPGIDYLPMEQSYIENILRLNKGAHVNVYASFPDSTIWRDKMFDGVIREAGRDHLVMSFEDGKWVLIPAIYINYIEFDEKIIYRPIELKKE